MFGRHRVNIGKNLYLALQQAGRQRGYATTEEFIQHLLESAVHRSVHEQEQAEVEQQLRGLGYIE